MTNSLKSMRPQLEKVSAKGRKGTNHTCNVRCGNYELSVTATRTRRCAVVFSPALMSDQSSLPIGRTWEETHNKKKCNSTTKTKAETKDYITHYTILSARGEAANFQWEPAGSCEVKSVSSQSKLNFRLNGCLIFVYD